MTPTLDTANTVVVVFTIAGCPACLEYKPRFERVAQAMAPLPMPVYFVDANDPQHAPLAERLQVEGVPATFVLRRPTGMIRVIGSIPDSQIAWLLGVAARAA